jgi:2-polyprenyl-3-methyl-5-hydroxy-6-metoxy-1,4-benzoquinol methylase
LDGGWNLNTPNDYGHEVYVCEGNRSGRSATLSTQRINKGINMTQNTPQGSYDFDAMENQETEFEWLRKRTAYRMAGLIPLLTEYGMENGKSILDVGCGQGIRTKEIAEQFPQSQVVGIDRSKTIVAAAQTGSESHPNLSFHCRDILKLPFEPNSFDFMYSRLVFMHLQEPLQAIQYLKTLLKHGGQIIIEDADRDFMKFYPHPDGFEEYWQKIQQGHKRLGGNPNIGTQLASLFSLSGMENIHININMQPMVGEGEQAA